MNIEGSRSVIADEKGLWVRVASGDDRAREEIILAYRPMVFWLAKKFHVPYNSYQDLVQEGIVGLIMAVDNFEAERGNRFITYAYHKTRGRMVNFLQRSEAKAPLPVEDEYLEIGRSFEPDDIDKLEWSLSVDAGLASLPEREEDIIRTLIIEGGKAADVAAKHGVGVSQIYRLQRAAIARLQKVLTLGL
ncbi:flagellar biosynthesis protein FliA [Synergistales bacterium]|nr:flagellar biosynthesis protein FliA [Synergistales bacterium]